MLGILNKTITKIFGSKADRDLKELNPMVGIINAEYAKISSLSNDELRHKTVEFKERINEHLKEIDDEITELEQKAEADPDMDLQEKEDLYRQVDTLKKDRNKKMKRY